MEIYNPIDLVTKGYVQDGNGWIRNNVENEENKYFEDVEFYMSGFPFEYKLDDLKELLKKIVPFYGFIKKIRVLRDEKSRFNGVIFVKFPFFLEENMMDYYQQNISAFTCNFKNKTFSIKIELAKNKKRRKIKF